MEQEQLKIFFNHSVDSKKVMDKVNDYLESYKDIGDPRKTRIEIIPREEFDPNISNEDLLKELDDGLRKGDYNLNYNYYNLWIKDDKVVILGFYL